MHIEITEKELIIFSKNIVKHVAKFVNTYMDEADECEHEKDVYLVETSDLIEQILTIEVDLKTIIQPKD